MSYFSQSAKKSSIQPNLNAPSPFRYNPAKLVKPSCAYTPFGSTAKLNRSVNTQEQKRQFNFNGVHIEPYQQYQTALNQLQNLVQKQQHSSSAFISKTQRFQANSKQTPGPGQYNLLSQRKRTHSHQKLKKQKTNTSMSASQLKVPSIPSDHLGYRQDENNVMKKVVFNVNLHPHPGSYDIRTNLTIQRGLKWQKQKNKQKLTEFTPGPGSYEFQIVSQLKAPVSSFVSQSNRFNQFNEKKVIKPGPGSYNAAPLRKKSHSNNQDGNFNSKTARFSFINDSTNVGPGQYFNSVKQRVKSKSVTTLKQKISSMQNIQSIVHRKTLFDEKNLNPGPGQYTNTTGITFKLQKELFRKFNDTTLPKQKRGIFEVSQSAVTPGPGRYSGQPLRSNDQKKLKKPHNKKTPNRTQVVNLKDYEEQITPSPFDYGNFNNTIESKIKQFQSKVTLTEVKPFGTGENRFKHYEALKNKSHYKFINQEAGQLEQTNQSGHELGYYQSNKKVKKLIMTNIKVKVPFGSSSAKMKQAIVSQSPSKFYDKQQTWLKKSHNIRSKLV